jgi:uncharacterized protein
VTDQDAVIERILTSYDTITVVGASAAAFKAAHTVPAHMQRHGWRIIPVSLVDVFRPSWQAPDIARQAVAAGATAEGAGLLFVEDRCLIIEQRRLRLEAPVR